MTFTPGVTLVRLRSSPPGTSRVGTVTAWYDGLPGFAVVEWDDGTETREDEDDLEAVK